MTTPPAQASGYPQWPVIEGNLSVVDLPGGSGVYGNIYAQRSIGLLTPAGLVNFLIIPPSGDSSGATDEATILNALAGAQYVMLGPGTFFHRSQGFPVASNQTFIGCGMHTTSLSYVGAAPIGGGAQVIAGGGSIIQNATVGGFQLFGNPNSGHSIQWRAKISTLRDVILQSPQSDCLHSDPNTIGGSISDNRLFNIEGIHPGANGYFQDTKVNDSDFYSMTFDGGVSGDSAVGSNIGFNLAGGSNNRFFGAHAFLFANGGASVGGQMNCFFGGEMESNGTADLIYNGAHHCLAHGVGFYDHANSVPPNQHILFTGTASTKITISDCDYRVDSFTVPNFYVNSSASTGINFHDNIGFNPVGLLTPPTYTAGSALLNPFPHRVRVFTVSTTAVSINGTATGLAAGTFELGPGETITPSGASGSWTWFGL